MIPGHALHQLLVEGLPGRRAVRLPPVEPLHQRAGQGVTPAPDSRLMLTKGNERRSLEGRVAWAVPWAAIAARIGRMVDSTFDGMAFLPSRRFVLIIHGAGLTPGRCSGYRSAHAFHYWPEALFSQDRMWGPPSSPGPWPRAVSRSRSHAPRSHDPRLTFPRSHAPHLTFHEPRERARERPTSPRSRQIPGCG